MSWGGKNAKKSIFDVVFCIWSEDSSSSRYSGKMAYSGTAQDKDLSALSPQCSASTSSVLCIYLVSPAVQRLVCIPALGMLLCLLYCLPFLAGDMSTPEPARSVEDFQDLGRNFWEQFFPLEYEAVGTMLQFWKQQFQCLLGRNSAGEIQL